VHGEPSAGYLDAIFTALRAFTDELAATKRWLSRAEQTDSHAWRLSFLHEARASFERAPRRLEAVVEHLSALGPLDALPPPLDRMRDNLVAMRADLLTQGERLTLAEEGVAPIGTA
jgi:hypothetical protein